MYDLTINLVVTLLLLRKNQIFCRVVDAGESERLVAFHARAAAAAMTLAAFIA